MNKMDTPSAAAVLATSKLQQKGRRLDKLHEILPTINQEIIQAAAQGKTHCAIDIALRVSEENGILGCLKIHLEELGYVVKVTTVIPYKRGVETVVVNVFITWSKAE